MRYLCLVYFEPQTMASLSEGEGMALRQQSIDYDNELRRRGHLIDATPLRPVETAVTIRSRGGRVVTTDGPFAETKEVLGGFLYFEVSSMDEALRLAADVPMARYGSIEVRQTQSIDLCGP
jgi:hypothetical protein